MRRLLPLAALALAVAPSFACKAVSRLTDRDEHPIHAVDVDNAALYLDLAEREIEDGRAWRAIDRLVALREIEELAPETRLRSEALLDRAASAALERGRDDVDALEELWDLDLTPRMRALAGIRLAERHLEEGSRVKAYRQVREVEEELPSHAERGRAGAVLAEAGLSLIADDGRYYLFLRYDARGAAALEFLVLTYPLDPRCAEAYAALARHYEDEGEVDLAIARNEDLYLFHPSHPLALVAEAEIPRLRLKLLDGPAFDRSQLVRALAETRSWLARHPDEALHEEVRATELECHGRLADSDMVLARYYRRVDNPFGARMHAERALSEAEAGRDAERIADARGFLEELGPPPDGTAAGEAEGAAGEPAAEEAGG